MSAKQAALQDLLARVRGATEGSADLDLAIEEALNPWLLERGYKRAASGWHSDEPGVIAKDLYCPCYTNSIDDAAALVERMLLGNYIDLTLEWRLRNMSGSAASCEIEDCAAGNLANEDHQTLPLAILAALLAALIAIEERAAAKVEG